MKKLILIFVVAGVFTACKKDKTPAVKETALSKIFQDGILINEFVFSGKKMTQTNSYDETTGKLNSVVSFEYDGNGRLIVENHYSGTNKLWGKILYSWNADGKIIKHEYKPLSGADSGQITVRVKYKYDGAGRITQQAWVDLDTDEIEVTQEMTYYDNGNLKSSNVYYYYAGKELQWKTEYSAGDPIPASLLKFQGYPINFYLFDLVAGERHFYSYDDNGAVEDERNDVFSKRKYDDKGFLVQQVVSHKIIKPLGLGTSDEMKYEYVEL